MTDPFVEREEKEGIRWNWTKYPSTKEAESSMVLPLGLLFSPLKVQDVTVLPYQPQLCKSCRAVLNPYCRLDYASRLWVCPFCLTRNPLPPQYQTPDQYPAELYPQFTTIEYQLQRPSFGAHVFFYCIDTCLPQDELDTLKDSILQSLQLLPEDSLIGLITYGSNVSVWELGFTELHKSIIFGGQRDYNLQEVREFLSLQPTAASLPGLPNQQAGQNTGTSRFLVPLSECELNLTSIIDELCPDPWPVKMGMRPHRCTGSALQIASILLQISGLKGSGRLLTFTGGAITKGPGMVVSPELSESMRHHNEIKSDQAPFWTAACNFYKGIGERLAEAGFSCDIFAACLDQIGIAEMASCCNLTGGFLFLSDSFKTPMFKLSFQRFFQTTKENHLNMAFNATIEVQTSRGTKVTGVIGPCSSLNKPSPSVSETEIGSGKTCAWQATALNNKTTYAFYFEVCGTGQEGTERYIQFITSYQHMQGDCRLRVTTIAHPIAPNPEPGYFVNQAAFDQDAAAVLVARVAVDMLTKNNNNITEALRWIDRTVINLVKRFGTYQPNDPSSLRLSQDFSLFPGFMYHLRRSEYIQVFNSSVDEVSFLRSCLLRESCGNDILMIQPTLHAYSFNGPASAVLLDSTSVSVDNILLLDTFFDVVIHYGSTMAAWIQQKYHERPEYEYFRQLLNAPKTDAERLMVDRFPHPRFTECYQNGSQARRLLNRLNPSVSYNSGQPGAGAVMLTDDASLQTFMAHLKRLVVTTS
eukprot:NODE_682_length_2465_cov_110.964560_g586_i0.p1 GENE.NODE_682_length_2465_cov_110.964560_g586_i0~~NODE_682_length_2465_cov_110.964560_g586_i0.p1  ORF type:complete len:754 (-),score=140.25 NODE_682_length_2465_cov_110.964560_g586_i0:145-2406(-)